MASYKEHVEQVRAAADLEEILTHRFHIHVSQHMALCPFHADANPSLSTSATLYHCFACQAGGDVFRLVEGLQSCSFPDAVAQVAVWVGVAPYQQTAQERVAQAQEHTIEAMTEWATQYYEQRMTPEAQAYLESRGLSPELIKRARCGWADGHLSSAVVACGGSADTVVAAGLARPSTNVHAWASDQHEGRDWLQQRVVIPTLERGQGVFLSGRTLDPAVEPKYLHQRNRPAPLFNSDALNRDWVLVVEGQLDALSLMRWDFPVVGLMGTPHAGQTAALRQAAQIYLCLDGDEAGSRATVRLATALGVSKCWVVQLPAGLDPNDMVRSHTLEEFQCLVNEAVDPITALLARLPITAVTNAKLLEPLFGLLASADPMEQEQYIHGPVTHWATGRAMMKAVRRSWELYQQEGVRRCAVCGAAALRGGQKG